MRVRVIGIAGGARRGRSMAGALVVVAAVLTAAAPAKGLDLPPGGGIDPFFEQLPGTSLGLQPELAGDIVADLTVPYSGGFFGLTSGQFQSRVVREHASGTLDFYYRIIPETGFVDSLRVGGFAGFDTDVDIREDLGGSQDFRGAFRSDDGDMIEFGTGVNSIGPPSESRFFLLRTDATEFDDNGTAWMVPPVGDSAEVPTFAPVRAVGQPTPIPLPPGAFMGLSGAVVIAVLKWRQRPAHSGVTPS